MTNDDSDESDGDSRAKQNIVGGRSTVEKIEESLDDEDDSDG